MGAKVAEKERPIGRGGAGATTGVEGGRRHGGGGRADAMADEEGGCGRGDE